MKKLFARFLLTLVIVLTMTAITSEVWAEGGSAKGSDIWSYHDDYEETLVKSIYCKTSSGIIHQWRYYPENLHLIFKPANKFREPDEGNYFDQKWEYDHSRYTETDSNPGELLDYYDDGMYYWVEINPQ